jgi:hypothetical protein
MRLRTVEPPPAGEKRLTVTAQAGPRIAVNVPMPAIGHPDAPVFQVLGELLSGDDGLLAKEAIRERQIATSARASGSVLRVFPVGSGMRRCPPPLLLLRRHLFDRSMLVDARGEPKWRHSRGGVEHERDCAIESGVAWRPRRRRHVFDASELPDRHQSSSAPNRRRRISTSALSFNLTVSRFIR